MGSRGRRPHPCPATRLGSVRPLPRPLVPTLRRAPTSLPLRSTSSRQFSSITPYLTEAHLQVLNRVLAPLALRFPLTNDSRTCALRPERSGSLATVGSLIATSRLSFV